MMLLPGPLIVYCIQLKAEREETAGHSRNVSCYGPVFRTPHQSASRLSLPTDAVSCLHAQRSSERLEQLHRIARRVLDQDLLAAVAGYDLAAELATGRPELLHRRFYVRNL